MKCPECKDGYPKGARFCPNCGYEPLKKRRAHLAFLVLTIPVVALTTWLSIASADEKNWLGVIMRMGILVLWVWFAVYSYRWIQWTQPIDSEEALAQRQHDQIQRG